MLLSRLARRVRYLFRRSDGEREMDEEMRLHLELEIEERIRNGLTPDEARRTALVDFGGVERHKEDARTARGVRPFEELAQDSRYAVRVLRKSPGFTVATLLIVAVGVAATTAVVSAVNALLLRPPPVSDPDRLYVLAEVWAGGERSWETNMGQYMYRYAHYRDVREATTTVFAGLAGFRYGTVALRTESGARTMSSVAVTQNYFQVLGLRPALGRLFSDTTEGATDAQEVVLSHDLWQSEFSGDSAIVGRTLFIDSQVCTVVGVAPRGFSGTMVGLVGDLWRPTVNATLTLFGRLRPGLSKEQAVAALSAIGPHLPADHPEQKIVRMTLDPMTGPPAMARGAVAGFLGMLFLVTALVLLIVTANVAGMFLARGAYRRQEIGVRLALGAGRGRLIRQLLTESLVLCSIGGTAGILLAHWLVRLIPAADLPIGPRTSLDLRTDSLVLFAAFAITLAAGVVAGLTPALQSTRVDLLSALRGTNAGQPRSLGRSRGIFVVAQLAMSCIVLVTAGLFVRALQRGVNIDRGLDARNVVVAEINLGPHGYDAGRGRAFYAQLMSRLAARSEIASVALGEWTPLSLSHNGEGIGRPDGGRIAVTWGVAGKGYIETMRIPMVAGRTFDDSDTPSGAPVAIVNETLGRALWPGQSAIGQSLRLNGVRQVVGVMRDGKYRELGEEPTAFAFIPLSQRHSSRVTIHARVRGDEAAGLAAIRAEVAALDPNVALEKVGSLEKQLELYVLPQRFAAWCVGAFGVLGLALAALGIYGVIAYNASQRAREFGIRLALGAHQMDIVSTVLLPGLKAIAVALALGLPAALAIGRVARRFLYGVSAADPVTLATVPLVLGVVALLASYLPARRAARIDPMISLRTD